MTQDSELLYRSNLEGVCTFIREKYNDLRRVLSAKDVQDYTGESYSAVRKKYFKKYICTITIENFARMISKS